MAGMVTFGEYCLDLGRHELLRGNEPIHLSPKAFHLLSVLVDAAPDAVSKQQLYERLWPDVIVEEANLKNLVAEIRAALRDTARNPRFVRTISRFGYAWRCEVTPAPAEAKATGAFLVYLGRDYPLRYGENVIGRDEDVQVLILAAPVSRRHASVLITSHRALLTDLASKNGTWLNGRRVTASASLADGDEIRLGSVALAFRSSGASTITDTRAHFGNEP